MFGWSRFSSQSIKKRNISCNTLKKVNNLLSSLVSIVNMLLKVYRDLDCG